MNTKQLTKKLMEQIDYEYVFTNDISDESFQLAIKFAQSLETPEEQAFRIKHFNDTVAIALKDAVKYN